MLRDRFVCGINNNQIQKRLLAETVLNSQKAVELALAMESASKSVGDLHMTKTNHANSARSTEHVDKVTHGKQALFGKKIKNATVAGETTSLLPANLRMRNVIAAKRKATRRRNVEIARKIKKRNHSERTRRENRSRRIIF